MQARFAAHIAIAAVCFMTSAPALAWGKIGHRVSAQIAESYLTDEARRQVTAILGAEDLAEASTWPDFMRSSPQEFWRKKSSPLHYVTIPVGKTYAEVGAPAEGDAITALAQFRATLLDETASLEQKQIALRFTVHVIGDLHQPLHAGNGTDWGGNKFTVSFFGRTTNLHSVWDTDLVQDEELSYTEMSHWLTRRLKPTQIVQWRQTDPHVWVTESAAIRDGIYPDADGDRDIRWNYIFQHRATVRTRLTQAGIRMAAYLNELFAAPAEATNATPQ
jgi:hypothetical protein